MEDFFYIEKLWIQICKMYYNGTLLDIIYPREIFLMSKAILSIYNPNTFFILKLKDLDEIWNIFLLILDHNDINLLHNYFNYIHNNIVNIIKYAAGKRGNEFPALRDEKLCFSFSTFGDIYHDYYSINDKNINNHIKKIINNEKCCNWC